MRARCYNEKSPQFLDYGARGIRICDRWRDDFSAFRDDMGPCPPRMTVERINNHGSYTCGKCDDCIAKGAPFNCRWATHGEQMRNTRRTHFITHNGEKLCLTDWAIRTGIPRCCLRSRLKLGWSTERLLTEQPKPGRRSKSAPRSAPVLP